MDKEDLEHYEIGGDDISSNEATEDDYGLYDEDGNLVDSQDFSEGEDNEDIDNSVTVGKSGKATSKEAETARKIAELNKQKLVLQRQLDTMKAREEAKSSTVLKSIKSLSAADTEYLDTLREEDPEQWRLELNALESRFKQEYEAKLSDAEKKANLTSVRKYIVESMQAEYPRANITEASLENLPYRLVKQLETGEVEYATFIEEASKYLAKGKTTARKEAVLGEPNLSRTRGASYRPSAGGKQSNAPEIF